MATNVAAAAYSFQLPMKVMASGMAGNRHTDGANGVSNSRRKHAGVQSPNRVRDNVAGSWAPPQPTTDSADGVFGCVSRVEERNENINKGQMADGNGLLPLRCLFCSSPSELARGNLE